MSASAAHWQAGLERRRAAAATGDRPFVTVSFAVSEDFCLSGTRGAPSRVSGEAALQVTHQLRTSHDALLVGVGTVLSDDPVLTNRLVPGRSPTRVVLDSRLRLPPDARVLRSTPEAPLVLATSVATEARELQLRRAGAEVLRVRANERGVDLPAALAALRARGTRSVMVEGGLAVLESFFEARLIDFLVVTVSPQRLDNAHAVQLGPLARATLAAWKGAREPVGGDTLLSGVLPEAAS